MFMPNGVGLYERLCIRDGFVRAYERVVARALARELAAVEMRVKRPDTDLVRRCVPPAARLVQQRVVPVAHANHMQ